MCVHVLSCDVLLCLEQVKEVYVKEAYRLLQRSIIFVEAEDIELEIEDDNDDDAHKDVNHTMEVSAEDEAAFVQAAEEAERQEQEAKAQAQIEGEVDAMLQHATEMEEAQDATYTGTAALFIRRHCSCTSVTIITMIVDIICTFLVLFTTSLQSLAEDFPTVPVSRSYLLLLFRVHTM